MSEENKPPLVEELLESKSPPEPEVKNLDYKMSFEHAAVRAHKMEAVLAAHNIKVNLSEISSEGLSVVDGSVVGDVAYAAAAPQEAPLPKSNAPQAITFEQVKNMSPEEINLNWEEISKVLEQQKVS